MKKKLLFLLTGFLLASCGSGGSFSTSKGVSVSAELKAGSVDTPINDYREISADLNLSVSSSDIISGSVYFDKVKLVYKDMKSVVQRVEEYPLLFSLKTGESKTVSIPLFTIADRFSSPYVYLNKTNPTTFGANYAEEVLATPFTAVLGQGACHTEQRCTVQGNQQVCQDVEVCQRDFNGSLPQETAPGTCKVVAGSSTLLEKDWGILSGDGSGVVQGRDIRVSFNEGPKQGVYVVAQCLSKIKPLSHSFLLLNLVYGDAVYSVSSTGLIKDSQGLVVGEVDGLGNVKFYSPLGSKPYPLTAFYYYPPTLGGELMGYGDGSSSYRMKTRYYPVIPSSVKVVADDGRGFSVSANVQVVDSSTGDITFSFPRPIPAGTPIFVQYQLSDLFQKIEVYVETDKGEVLAGVVNLRVRSGT